MAVGGVSQAARGRCRLPLPHLQALGSSAGSSHCQGASAITECPASRTWDRLVNQFDAQRPLAVANRGRGEAK